MNIPFIFGKKKEGVEEPTLTQEQLQEAIENSTKYLMPRPNDDVEFIVPLFNARKHYKHLKKQMWKFSHK